LTLDALARRFQSALARHGLGAIADGRTISPPCWQKHAHPFDEDIVDFFGLFKRHPNGLGVAGHI
jgi:hypothetical protein